MASNLLTPEELAALAECVDSGELAVDTGFNMQARVVKHDLASEDSTLGINLTSIDMINERFIRMFRLGLLEVLRTSPRINPARVRILKFGDYLKDLKPPLSVTTCRALPLRGYSMIIIEPNIIFSSLDNFFGGFGRGIGALPPGRLFTPTESRIIKIMLDQLYGALQEAWAPLLPVHFEHVSSEINPQFAQIADENDLVILSRFEAEIGDNVKGFIDIVYPYASLKPIRELLRSRLQTGDGQEESDKIWTRSMELAAGDARLRTKVELAKVKVSLKDFEELEVGQVLYFKKPDYARLIVNDVPIYASIVGTHGNQVAIRIENPIKPESTN